ncbi:terminase family protein [Hymenobacter aerilatus]|uniref:Terminase family protein n=1 Tax=Hymenobacter aerilatus TaxID=2932251 RepID=A0A8T9T1Y0_9BACT|nr:terminase family protein [Hymenobacter aerilatus]UOR07184.1 terminase family protein [Hymenobacter aerilatus]
MPNVRFTPSKKQFDAYGYLTDDETEFIGYGGSAFSGKSYLLCYWLTIMCLAYPDTGWGLGRRELTNLKKTTLLTLFKVFAESDIKSERDYTYNQQLNIITFTNGSQIFLIDTAYKPSDPLYARFGGFELTGCAVDESAETAYSAIEILYTRCGRRRNHEYGIRRKMLETFNPDKGHVYKRYYRPHRDGIPKPRHIFIPALPADNPSPEVPDYIAGILATASKATIQRLINGNFEYDDVKGALWRWEMLEPIQIAGIPKHVTLRRTVIAVDPAVSSKEDSDETGIVVVGLGSDNLIYVLEDATGIYTPLNWASKVSFLYDKYQADRVVAEVNNGGDLVEVNVRQVNKTISYKAVHATKGKYTRAEPVAALYEQARVRHLPGLDALESQQTGWSAGEGQKSPNNIDALVWGITELALAPTKERKVY